MAKGKTGGIGGKAIADYLFELCQQLKEVSGSMEGRGLVGFTPKDIAKGIKKRCNMKTRRKKKTEIGGEKK